MNASLSTAGDLDKNAVKPTNQSTSSAFKSDYFITWLFSTFFRYQSRPVRHARKKTNRFYLVSQLSVGLEVVLCMWVYVCVCACMRVCVHSFPPHLQNILLEWLGRNEMNSDKAPHIHTPLLCILRLQPHRGAEDSHMEGTHSRANRWQGAGRG